MKGIQFFLNPPFIASMATAAKFVKPIPIFLAYLVPLDVDAVPIKFHQFLFGELLLIFFHTFLSALFLGDTLIKLYETL
jgi:hypothetical protein